MADSSSEQWLKNLPLVGPLYVTSIALCYDVGFFYGIGIGFFTFFNVTEHLLFALQAIPAALIPAATIIGTIYIAWWVYEKGAKEIADLRTKLPSMTQDERDEVVRVAEASSRNWRRGEWPVRITMAITVVASLWTGNFSTAIVLLATQLGLWLIIPFERLQSPLFRVALVLVAVSTGWLTAFAVGYERSVSLISSNTFTERLSTEIGSEPVKIIRSGDKGVLYKSAGPKAVFLRWDAIKKIEGF